MAERYAGQERHSHPLDKLESKVAIGVALYSYAMGLPTPRPDDPSDSRRQERDQVVRLFRSFAGMYPEIVPPHLSGKSRRGSRDDSEENPDFKLVNTFQDGMKEVINRREQIRNIYRNLGYDWQNPQRLKEYVKGRGRRQILAALDHAISVHPFPFSIGILVEEESLAEIEGKGISGHNYGIWSVIEHTRMFRRTFNHEDFHALYRCFRTPWGLDYLDLEYQQLIVDYSKRANVSYPGRNVSMDVWDRRISTTMLQEHVLTDFYAGYDRADSSNPSYLFSSYGHSSDLVESINDTKELVERSGGKNAPAIVRSLDGVAKSIDHNHLKRYISGLFDLVSRYNPDKLIDLEVAFAVLPITQWNHVESLVRKWTGQRPSTRFFVPGK